MLSRRLYIIVIILSVLFFSAQKSKGCNRMVHSKHKVHCNFLKKPVQSSRAGVQDLLINMDDRDDDETTSRTKHKLNRSSVVLALKFHPYAQQSLTHALRASTNLGKGRTREDHRFLKTPLTIAFCCFRI